MTDIKKELTELGNSIILVNLSGYMIENGRFVRLAEYNRTYNKITETFDNAIETVKKLKNNSNMSDTEKQILLRLVNELLKECGCNERTIEEKKQYRSYKLDRLASCTTILKNEIKDFNIIKAERVENVNDWIKSLRIFKLSKKESVLLDSYYQTVEELYSDLRDALLNKKITAFKLLYIKKIIEIIENSENKEMLQENDELFNLLESFKSSNKIKERMKSITLKGSIQGKVEGAIFGNKIKMILKNE